MSDAQIATVWAKDTNAQDLLGRADSLKRLRYLTPWNISNLALEGSNEPHALLCICVDVGRIVSHADLGVDDLGAGDRFCGLICGPGLHVGACIDQVEERGHGHHARASHEECDFPFGVRVIFHD